MLGDTCFQIRPIGQSEIGQMRFAFCIQQNVSRLDVSMQNAVFMRVMHGARDLGDQVPPPAGSTSARA